MTKQEALQLFVSHVDIPALKADFPDIEYVATELDDGQQEIIIRLQGEDADFRPAADLAVIDAMTRGDLPDGLVKNNIVLRRHKRKLSDARNQLRDLALLKRIKTLIEPAGVSLRKIADVIKENIPVTQEESP
ncbi:MAG: hypothetical protein FVQ82_13005 [Planctomycetes bacterium]|nr:hypothetical protein [Planctomycetota bacterium]